ncbi:sulfotransferase [Leptothoe kymatousa TAU-MAC 1615]|uniref:Sulfotransferase n=2 Tax=Leptothoe TaxID=2651725 RepID=A0ABS5Y3Q9_9CYAN|nr:sulfotransferase [Leptothoe kymatousa TAU-MAC 1615]
MKSERLESNLFFLLTSPRSGSTWLLDLLNSHPDIAALQEAFLKKNRLWDDPYLETFTQYCSNRKRAVRPWVTFDYLKNIQRYPTAHKIIGCKMMYKHLIRHPEIIPKIFIENHKIVHLVRENHLDVAISLANRDKYKFAHTKEKKKLSAVYLDPKFVWNVIYSRERNHKIANFILRKTRINQITVTYESLLSEHRDPTLNAVFKHLDIPINDIELKSELKKINIGNYENKIENFDEIRTSLAGTKFEKFLC